MRFGNRPNFHLLITVDWLQSAAILKNHLEKSKPTLDPSPPTAGHGCSLLLYWPCDLCWKVLPLSVSTELHWLCSPVSCSQNINAFTEAEVRAALISSLSSEVIQPLVDLKVCLFSVSSSQHDGRRPTVSTLACFSLVDAVLLSMPMIMSLHSGVPNLSLSSTECTIYVVIIQMWI